MDQVLDEFAFLLDRRFQANAFTTEDSIRYTFFAALLKFGIAAEEISLEHPHPTIPGARVDTAILSSDQVKPMIAEFKYDRENLSGHAQPRPQKAGAAFADLARLLAWPGEMGRYFIYVTDEELHSYWSGPRNGLAPVYDLRAGSSMSLDDTFFHGRSDTLLRARGTWDRPVLLHCLLSQSLRRNHYVRVYRVENPVGHM